MRINNQEHLARINAAGGISNNVTDLYVYNCSALGELNVPDSVAYLYVDNCSALGELNVPDSVTYLPRLKLESIDGVLTAYSGNWKKHGDIEHAEGFMVNGAPPFTPAHIVKGGGYASHGETLEEAIQDHAFKALGNINASEIASLIVSDNIVTMARWRGITGACSMGTRSHLKNKGFGKTPTELKLTEALKLSAGTIYGDNFARQIERAKRNASQ